MMKIGSARPTGCRLGTELWAAEMSQCNIKWRHNERDDVLNHRQFYCLFKCLFRLTCLSASELFVLWEGIHRWPSQRTSNEKAFSWRHHDLAKYRSWEIGYQISLINLSGISAAIISYATSKLSKYYLIDITFMLSLSAGKPLNTTVIQGFPLNIFAISYKFLTQKISNVYLTNLHAWIPCVCAWVCAWVPVRARVCACERKWTRKLLILIMNELLPVWHLSVFCTNAECSLVGPLSTKHIHDDMKTSSSGNIFRVTGHLCGEFTGLRWIPLTKASDAELWCLLWSASE